MRKPKIQPLIPFMLSRSQINPLLFLRHSIPFLVPTRIAPNIVRLSKQIDKDIRNHQSNKNLVPPLIPRRIVYPSQIRYNQRKKVKAYLAGKYLRR